MRKILAIGSLLLWFSNPSIAQWLGPSKSAHSITVNEIIVPSITGTQCWHSVDGVLGGTGSDCGAGGGGAWGSITGTLSNQTDLQAALDAKVPTTLTVQGHALSGNVTISATEIASGTLPHAQLPALLGGDIPNNAANTSGTAAGLSANIAESQVTNLAADLGSKVPTSTTVNGHALSSNVTVSASDLITGTLPHAQLPALLSGDIPANSANTSGTAGGLSAPIAESQVTNLVSDLSGKASSNASTTVNGQVCSLGGTCAITAVTGQQAYKTSDTAGSASNTLVTTGMTFAIAANTSYTLDCNLIFTVSTTSGVGLTLGVNGPGTPTQVSLTRQINTSATAFRVDSSQTATWAAKVGATATTVTALSRAEFSGLIENGSTAGTLDVQYANIGTTGTTIIKRGSWCKLQ